MNGVVLVFLACLLWAFDTLIRYPLIYGGMSATTIVFTEHLILVLLFSPMVIKVLKKLYKKPTYDLVYFIIVGGLGSAIATLSFTKAFSILNPSLVILLQKLQPVVAIVLARIFLKEKMKKEFLLWGVLCLFGGFLISYNDIFNGSISMKLFEKTSNSKLMLGYALTMIAVLGWGSATVFGKQLWNDKFSQTEILGGRYFFGLLFLIPFIVFQEFPLPTSTDVFFKILLMVFISGLLGMYLYYQGLKKIPVRLCAIAEMFFPFCAVGVNWIFLDKGLDIYQIFGGGLLLIGSTVIQVKHY